MPIYRDKNNNPHTSKREMNKSDMKIDADHILKTLFFMNDEQRSQFLETVSTRQLLPLIDYVQMKTRERERATDAVVEEQKGF